MEPDESRQSLNDLIEAVGLDDLQKVFLRSRWLSDLRWQDGRAKRYQRLHYVFRLVAIVGGVIVPALVGLNPADEVWRERVRGLAFLLSLLVAIAVSVEGFFRFGDRWRHYRGNAELLKSEGWMFFQKSGRYRNAGSHGEAYPEFAEQVEAILRQDVDQYLADIAQERRDAERA
jgi:Protein of unknown function (DUF4231)